MKLPMPTSKEISDMADRVAALRKELVDTYNKGYDDGYRDNT